MYTSIVACISMEVTFFFSASCWSFTLKKRKNEMSITMIPTALKDYKKTILMIHLRVHVILDVWSASFY